MHSGRRRGAKAGMDVLPLCLLSMAPVPLAGRAAVFHYPKAVSIFHESWIGTDWHGALRCSLTPGRPAGRVPAPRWTLLPVH